MQPITRSALMCTCVELLLVWWWCVRWLLMYTHTRQQGRHTEQQEHSSEGCCSHAVMAVLGWKPFHSPATLHIWLGCVLCYNKSTLHILKHSILLTLKHSTPHILKHSILLTLKHSTLHILKHSTLHTLKHSTLLTLKQHTGHRETAHCTP